MDNFQALFNQVSALNEKYKKINELTGENFNVFRILKLESSEVRMHSAFIGELLDPTGSHGQGDIFLKLFINQFKLNKNDYDIHSCKVTIEKHAGFINEDRTEGGRIDIIISDKTNNEIIIENKIYTGDQTNQLVRYYNHSPKADIIYLTLDGKEPSKESKGDLLSEIHYKCYSYKIDIINWLIECRKQVAILPIIRESITQYINLIKYMTNQTINDTMKEDLTNIIRTNLEASFMIYNGVDEACLKLLEKLKIQLDDLSSHLGLKFNYDVKMSKSNSGFWFRKNEWKYVNIGFQFSNYESGFQFGFATLEDPSARPIPIELRTKLGTIAGKQSKESGWWPMVFAMEKPYDNWEKFEAWEAIEKGSMFILMKEKIEHLLKITEGIEL